MHHQRFALRPPPRAGHRRSGPAAPVSAPSCTASGEDLDRQVTGKHKRQRRLGVAAIGRRVHRAGRRPDIDAAGGEAVNIHRIAQGAGEHGCLRMSRAGHMPCVAAICRAIHPEPPVDRHAVLVRLLGHNEQGAGCRVSNDRKAKPRQQPLLDAVPSVPAIGGAIHTAMVLTPDGVRVRPDRQTSGWTQCPISGCPSTGEAASTPSLRGSQVSPPSASVEHAHCRDTHPHAGGVAGIHKNPVCCQTAESRLPMLPGHMLVEPVDRLPAGPVVLAEEKARLIDTGEKALCCRCCSDL